MNIMVVDNHYQRLGRLVGCIRKAFPNDEIIDFVDPFRAVQYSASHIVDVVFTNEELQPFHCLKLAELVTYYCKGAKVYTFTAEALSKDSLIPEIDEALSELLTQTTLKGGLREISLHANEDIF